MFLNFLNKFLMVFSWGIFVHFRFCNSLLTRVTDSNFAIISTISTRCTTSILLKKSYGKEKFSFQTWLKGRGTEGYSHSTCDMQWRKRREREKKEHQEKGPGCWFSGTHATQLFERIPLNLISSNGSARQKWNSVGRQKMKRLKNKKGNWANSSHVLKF